MKKSIIQKIFLTLFLLLITVLFITISHAQAQDRPDYVPDEIFVKFRSDVSQQTIASLLSKINGSIIKKFKLISALHVKIPTDSVQSSLNFLRNLPEVEYAEPNCLRYLNAMPNDPSFSDLWGLNNTGQTGGTPDADVDAAEAWNIVTGDSNFVVAVIDSGMDMSHPDLSANVWTNPDEIPGNGIDDDGNGYADDIYGWDFSGGDNDPSDTVAICGGHGTHTSGTIGASGNNGIGVTGINWNVKIMPLKVFKQYFGIFCSAADSDIIDAISYASDKGVKVSNNSYGGGPFNQALYDAIKASKKLFVAAAGNEGLNNDITPSYPASYNLSNIISVAATDHNDALPSFSNYGVASVDIAAPGVNILSTTPNNTYSFFDGTSMASPHVVGAAALLWAYDPTLTVNEVKWRLMEGSDSKGLPVSTGGRLNINNSINLSQLVTIDMSTVGSTTVPRSGTIKYLMTVTNISSSAQTAIVNIIAQLANGTEVYLIKNSSLTLLPGGVYTKTFSRKIPYGVPVGELLISGSVEVGSQSLDEDIITYTIY